jgi:chorismate synthase
VLRWITAGESHGPALVAVLEGMVAGVEITTKELAAELARRRLGYGRGARMKFEADELEVIGGLRHGLTQGGPVAVRIGNTEWPKWETVMSADPVDPELIENRARNAPLTRPRPGHADLAGMTKFGFDDARPVLERASARETASRVVLGTVAKAFLRQGLGVDIVSHVVELGTVEAPDGELPGPGDLERVDASPVRAYTESATEAMVAEVDAAQREGDTRRRGRGDRVRNAGRGGQLRAFRPSAGCAAGRGADGHPGHEGRRDRRRFPHRAAAGQRGARRDGARCPGDQAEQPRRRDRGRHDQR